MHMLNPKPDSFYHPDQKMALGYLNPSYLKKAQLKQQSLYNGNLLLEEHDPHDVYHSEETLKLTQESREKMRFLKKEIKPANYAKINHLSGVFVPQTTKSKEELFLSNASNMVTISKTISIPNDDLSDDTTPSVARKFLNKVKNSLLTLQRVVKQKITLEVHNWSCSTHKEVKRLQAQLRDLKGKSSEIISASTTLDPLNQKLETKIVELEFQVVNYEREISHLKTTYKNLFDSITSNQAHAKLHNLIYENAKLRAKLFENTSESMNNTSGTSVTPQVDKPKLIAVTPYSKKLHASILSHSVPQPREFNVVKHSNMIAPAMFKIDPSQTSMENVSSDTVNASFTRILLLSKNQKTMSFEYNNIKLAIRNDKYEIVCGTCKQCLVTANHDAYLLSSINALNSRANNLCANVPLSANQKRHRIQVWKPKQVGFKERLTCTPKPRLPRFSLKWSPSGRIFDLKGKLVASKETNCPNDDKACPSNPQEPIRKQFPNSTVFLGRLSKFISDRFENDHIAAILDMVILNGEILQSPGRNTCFIRDLDGVDLLKGNRSTNLYTINLYDIASASPICLGNGY
nr:hypothetical protein [Tanacetum cinerariifolium]